MNQKVRNAQLQKIPYVLVVGDTEVRNELVSVRHQQRGPLGTQSMSQFLMALQEEVDNKKDLPNSIDTI